MIICVYWCFIGLKSCPARPFFGSAKKAILAGLVKAIVWIKPPPIALWIPKEIKASSSVLSKIQNNSNFRDKKCSHFQRSWIHANGMALWVLSNDQKMPLQVMWFYLWAFWGQPSSAFSWLFYLNNKTCFTRSLWECGCLAQAPTQMCAFSKRGKAPNENISQLKQN